MALADSLPRWLVIDQLGHNRSFGFVSLDTSVGTPLLLVDVPAVEGDDIWEGLPAEQKWIHPGTLYSVSEITEAEARRKRSIERLRRRPIALLTVEAHELPDLLADDVVTLQDAAPGMHFAGRADCPCYRCSSAPAPAVTSSARPWACPCGVGEENGCTPDDCKVPF